MDKKEIVSKYVTFCGKLYDKVSTFFNGPHEQTPESIKKCQVRGTWIVSLFIGFAVIGAFMDDEEENTSTVTEEVENDENSVPVTKDAPVKTETKRSDSSWSYTPTMSVYVCAKCATVVTGSSQPRSVKCPAYNGSHQWDNIGAKGDTNYQCGNCGASISSRPTPKPGRCPRGYGHKWNSLR